MMKDLSRKQIIILISLSNLEKFIVLSNKYITNINRALKDVKLDIMADFIWANNRGLIITINKVTSTSDFNTIKNYIKNINAINLNDIILPKLL